MTTPNRLDELFRSCKLLHALLLDVFMSLNVPLVSFIGKEKAHNVQMSWLNLDIFSLFIYMEFLLCLPGKIRGRFLEFVCEIVNPLSLHLNKCNPAENHVQVFVVGFWRPVDLSFHKLNLRESVWNNNHYCRLLHRLHKSIYALSTDCE